MAILRLASIVFAACLSVASCAQARSTETAPQTLLSMAINGSSSMLDGLLKITDAVNGAVGTTLRPDTVFINRTYNGTTTSGYTSGGAAVYDYLGYGTTNPSTDGSVALLGGSVNVYNSSNGTTGRSEFTPIALAVVPIKGGSFAAGSNYYYDLSMQTPSGTGGQEGFLSTINGVVQKRTQGNVIDANHGGSFAGMLSTTPNNTGFDSQDHSSDVTYPLNALMAIVGWSGEQSATAALGGSAPTATPAAEIGFQIGGVGGVWDCPACNSYIPIGLDIQDYTTEAIHIHSPNLAHSPSNIAIAVDAGAGNVVVGQSVYVADLIQSGTLSVSAMPIGNASGGMYVCIDPSGNTYKKSSCP